MFKTALFDCAINEKCCSVDGGRGICPLFLSPPRGVWQLNTPHPQEFAIQGKKMLMPGVSPVGGGRGLGGHLGAAGIDWCIIPISLLFCFALFLLGMKTLLKLGLNEWNQAIGIIFNWVWRDRPQKWVLSKDNTEHSSINSRKQVYKKNTLNVY